MTAVDQKRIAANTILLYVRMLVVMVVGLYTSRVVINALGKEYYGLFDAVSQIVLLVSFLTGPLSTACQRYYSYDLEHQDYDRLKRIFSISLTIFVILTLAIVLLAETAGYWYLMHNADVNGHYHAAKWVFQFSIISFALYVMRVPYQGMIIAREKMKVFAYLSLFEAFATLGVAAVLIMAPDDKDSRIILYAGLRMTIQLITSLFHWLYCRLFYKECRFKLVVDKEQFKEMFSYSGWNMIGSSADVFKNMGLTLLLNAHFGLIMSAARAIANKVQMTITQLNFNFFTAVRPQIYKSYVANEIDDMHKLICQSSKFSFYLLFVVALPLLLEAEFILPLWLREDNVPDIAYILTRLMIIEALVNSLTSPLTAPVQATGNIRNFQLTVGITMLTILPLSYLAIKFLNMPAPTVLYISIAVSLLAQALRVWFVYKQTGLRPGIFVKTSVLPILVVTAISSAISVVARSYLYDHCMMSRTIRSLIVIAICIAVTSITSFLIGMNGSERRNGLNMIKGFLSGQGKREN